MNKCRVEALLEAAKACVAIGDEMMKKPQDQIDTGYVIAATECTHAINMLLAKEADLKLDPIPKKSKK